MTDRALNVRYFLSGLFILTAYWMLVGGVADSSLVVMIADVISGLSVMGIAVCLYPLLKTSGPRLSAFYFILKMAEGGSMIIAGLLFPFAATEGFRSWVYESFHIYVFILSALFLYILIYKSGVLPRFIAFWGYAAVAALSLSNCIRSG